MFWEQGKTIKFKNSFQGQPTTNFLNKKSWLVANTAQGETATFMVQATKFKGDSNASAPPNEMKQTICAYLAGPHGATDLHIETKRLICAIDCPEVTEPRMADGVPLVGQDGKPKFPAGKRAASLGVDTYWDCDDDPCDQEDAEEREACKKKNKERRANAVANATSGANLAATGSEETEQSTASDPNRPRDSKPIEARDSIPPKEVAKWVAAGSAIAVSAIYSHKIVSALPVIARLSRFAMGGVASSLASVFRSLGILSHVKTIPASQLAAVRAAAKVPPNNVVSLAAARAAKASQASKQAQRVLRVPAPKHAKILMAALAVGIFFFAGSASAAEDAVRRTSRSKRKKKQTTPCSGPMTKYGIRNCGNSGNPTKVAQAVRQSVIDEHFKLSSVYLNIIEDYVTTVGSQSRGIHRVKMAESRNIAEDKSGKIKEKPADRASRRLRKSTRKLAQGILDKSLPGTLSYPQGPPGEFNPFFDKGGKWDKSKALRFFKLHENKSPYVLWEYMIEQKFIDQSLLMKIINKLLPSHGKIMAEIKPHLLKMDSEYGVLTIKDILAGSQKLASDKKFKYPETPQILGFFQYQYMISLKKSRHVLVSKNVALSALRAIKNLKNVPQEIQGSKYVEIFREAAQNGLAEADSGAIVAWIWDLSRAMEIKQNIPPAQHEKIRLHGFKAAVRTFFHSPKNIVENDNIVPKILNSINERNRYKLGSPEAKEELRRKAAAQMKRAKAAAAAESRKPRVNEALFEKKINLKIKTQNTI